MILPLFLILLLLAALLIWRRQHRIGGTLLVLALAGRYCAGCGYLSAPLLDHLQSGFPAEVSAWGPRNIIVLLGAGTAASPDGQVEPSLYADGRILRAAELYRACKLTAATCKVEVSGGDADHTGRTEAQTYAITLAQLGVPLTDMILESRSLNTFQNAQFSRPLLLAYAADKVVLVSSAVHLKRAMLYFGHFGIRAQPVRGDYLDARRTWLPNSENLLFADLALHEYLGIWRYHLYNALGWNPP